MKTLQDITPSAEQLTLIVNTRPGVSLIRGSAGSGKTTTAILRLKQLMSFWRQRRKRENIVAPIKVLVATYNRTLSGYVADLAQSQISTAADCSLTVSTFAKWSVDTLPSFRLLDDTVWRGQVGSLGASLSLDREFLLDEVDYVLGRFQPANYRDYLTCRRDGRGASPRVDLSLRTQILNQVIAPYTSWKAAQRKGDWHDLSTAIATMTSPPKYQIIIADEAQDLTANQVRALHHVVDNPSSLTFVLDATQRIYPRGFMSWTEAGVAISPGESFRLKSNHRNTKEICEFASGLLDGMDMGDDGTMPDFKSCSKSGLLPTVLTGKYSGQLGHAVAEIKSKIDLAKDSVAFLKPLGGGWFDETKAALNRAGLPYCEITRQSEWPKGTENIALSTMASAKGLEFDHVFILGCNEEVLQHGTGPGDNTKERLRRMLAMAITRARKSVTVGYKPSEASSLMADFKLGTFQKINV